MSEIRVRYVGIVKADEIFAAELSGRIILDELRLQCNGTLRNAQGRTITVADPNLAAGDYTYTVGAQADVAAAERDAEIADLQQKVNSLMGIVPTLVDSALVWHDSGSVPSTRTDDRNKAFKTKVTTAYGDNTRCCVLFEFTFPPRVMVSAHIMKAQHDEVAASMGMDVWDVRNGLRLFKVLERAYDNSKLCFYKDDEGKIRLHILHNEGKIVDSVYLNPEDRAALKKMPNYEALAELTLGQLEGRELQLPPGVNPYMRALSLQARQARRYALRKGWTDAQWDFKDFGTETATLTRVREWLDTSPSEHDALSRSDV